MYLNILVRRRTGGSLWRGLFILERLRQLVPFPEPEELDSLLPWAEELPEEIKTKTKPKK